MKSNFKPKSFTKKEWQDARARAASGSGVGKALDQFQKACPWDLNGLTAAQLTQAEQSCKLLETTLNTAAKKCNANKHKETLAGIAKYKVIITNYKKAIVKSKENAAKRATYIKGLDTLAAMLKDAAVAKNFVAWTKGDGDCYPEMHTYSLLKAGKYEDVYDKYASSGKVNIEGRFAVVLAKRFGEKVDVPDTLLKKVSNNTLTTIYTMLNSNATNYRKSDTFKEFLKKKYLVPTFTF